MVTYNSYAKPPSSVFKASDKLEGARTEADSKESKEIRILNLTRWPQFNQKASLEETVQSLKHLETKTKSWMLWWRSTQVSHKLELQLRLQISKLKIYIRRLLEKSKVANTKRNQPSRRKLKVKEIVLLINRVSELQVQEPTSQIPFQLLIIRQNSEIIIMGVLQRICIGKIVIQV